MIGRGPWSAKYEIWGISKFFYRKLGALNFFRYHQNNDCYNDIDKTSKELSGTSHLCSTIRSRAVAFGNTFTLDLI